MATKQEALELVHKLALDLATELDLHYEDEDLFALQPSFSLLEKAIATLRAESLEVHADLESIVRRYHRNVQ